jgi:hypothetical protein
MRGDVTERQLGTKITSGGKIDPAKLHQHSGFGFLTITRLILHRFDCVTARWKGNLIPHLLIVKTVKITLLVIAIQVEDSTVIVNPHMLQ